MPSAKGRINIMFLKNILHLFTKSGITSLLSILGFLSGVSSWLYTFVKNRKHFSVEIIGCHSTCDGLLLRVLFSNHSELPLSINEVAVLYDSHEYVCQKFPVKVLEIVNKRDNVITSQQEYFSMQFPINLPPLCGDSGYLFFPAEKGNFPLLSKQVTLIIRTNRGREARKTLSLENPPD